MMKSLPSSSFPPKTTTSLTFSLRVMDAPFSAPKKKNLPLPVIEDDSEISIFDAHNYFNEHDHQQTVAPAVAAAAGKHCESQSAATRAYDRNYRPRPFHTAPTEAGAWNSQRGLVYNSSAEEMIGVNVDMNTNMNFRGIASKKRKTVWSWKWFLGILICGGKKEPKRQTKRLLLNPMHEAPKMSAKHGHRQMVLPSGFGFSFPILSQPPPPPPPPVKMVFTSARNPIPLEEPLRDSLEIFRPSNGCIISDSITPPPKSGDASIDDGVASDTSSDLFGRESTFMAQTNNHSLDEVYRRFGYFRRSLDEFATPSVAPTKYYEPSEASIDWSVTTAEGFDRDSVRNFSASASDIVDDDVILMRLKRQRLVNDGEGGRRRGDGMMMSCRCGVSRRGLSR